MPTSQRLVLALAVPSLLAFAPSAEARVARTSAATVASNASADSGQLRQHPTVRRHRAARRTTRTPVQPEG